MQFALEIVQLIKISHSITTVHKSASQSGIKHFCNKNNNFDQKIVYY